MCAPTRHTAGLGAKQNASPLMKFRGEARINVPRFHPACRKREAPAALCPPVTGRPRPARRGRLGSGTAAALRGTLPPLRVPLCAPLRGFFSVCAGLTGAVYHRAGEMSRPPAPPMGGKTAPPSTGAGRPSPLADPGVGLPGEDQVVHVLGRIPRGLGPFVFLHHNRSFFHTYSLPIQISICGRGRVHDRIFSLTPGGDSLPPGPPASPRGPWGRRAPPPAPLPGRPAPSGGPGPPPAPRRWR